MIKEYHFAALLYDESEKMIRCAACGREISTGKIMFRTGGRWICGRCVNGFDAPTESALCSTLKAAVER